MLHFTAELAVSCATTLHVLHVIPAVDELSQIRGVTAGRKYLFDIAREKWDELRKSANINADLMLAVEISLGRLQIRRYRHEGGSNGATVVVIARAKCKRRSAV